MATVFIPDILAAHSMLLTERVAHRKASAIVEVLIGPSQLCTGVIRLRERPAPTNVQGYGMFERR